MSTQFVRLTIFLSKTGVAVDEGHPIVVLGVGTYGAVMSSNYNTRPKPAEVLVDGDQFFLVAFSAINVSTAN